jgi:predicted component of type VI protein secretion system
MLPWRENERLIKALYERVQQLEGELNHFRGEFNKLALITELKNELVNRVFTDLKPILSKELSESIADAVQKKLTNSRQGLV